MKKLINVTEVEGEGLEALIGEQVLILCMNYFYTGKLVGVNTTCILLEYPSIVYDTGAFDKKGYTDAQKLHTKQFYIQIGAIEAYGVSK